MVPQKAENMKVNYSIQNGTKTALVDDNSRLQDLVGSIPLSTCSCFPKKFAKQTLVALEGEGISAFAKKYTSVV